MRQNAVLLFAALLAPALPLASRPALAQDAAPAALATERERVQYSIGFNMASNLKQQGIEVDLDLIIRGMRDALSPEPDLLTSEEIRIGIQKYQTLVRQIRSKNAATVSTSNRVAGEAFLRENKAKPGVVTLPSGLQYKVLQAGTGPKPAATDTVDLKFRGTLLDGRMFETTPEDGKAASYRVANLNAGLQEVLQLMPAGSKWQVFIPSALGYGPRGKATIVGPNSVLTYDLELVAVQKGQTK